jgi:hypothetical protein
VRRKSGIAPFELVRLVGPLAGGLYQTRVAGKWLASWVYLPKTFSLRQPAAPQPGALTISSPQVRRTPPRSQIRSLPPERTALQAAAEPGDNGAHEAQVPVKPGHRLGERYAFAAAAVHEESIKPL